MGLCVSKPYANDYATFSQDPNGEFVINRRLVGVRPGEDVQPRLHRLDRKAMKQLMRGKLPYEDFEEARAHDLRQSFQPASPPRASASRTLPEEITFLRMDSEGCLIQTTLVNPSHEERDMAQRQKAQLLRELGPAGVARLQPVGFERCEKMEFRIDF